MIIECLAGYHQDLRRVTVSAVVQDDDGSSLYQHVKTAMVQLLYHDSVFLQKSVTSQDYNQDEQMFFCFFLNPAVEDNLYCLFEIETFEGKRARVRTPVRQETQLPYEGVEQNPSLPTRTPLDFTDSTYEINGVVTPL